ncbi:MAG: VanZ family protein [Anaerostipes hadrus]|nr:VanZ family protein [Anaerostipes hadrus]
MYRIYSTLIEMVAATVFIIPIWCIYNKLYFRSWKITFLYMIFGFYLTAVLALVGFPNIISLKVEWTVNAIPFVYMINDFINACLNVLLFVPFGFFLPVLWKAFRNTKKLFATGFAMTSFIEIAQIFTGRTTDLDDIITNIAGTLIGYLIAYWYTGVFTRRIVKNSKKNDFYIICASVILIMFFLQPFISSLLWEMIL